MKAYDRIIANLIRALAAIEEGAEQDKPLAYLHGIAHQAQLNARSYQERNRDGYYVVKASLAERESDGWVL